jgi:hypothetical protein
MIRIRWERQALVWIHGHPQRAVARAAKRAGRDALRALRAEAKRSLRERTRIRAGYLAAAALPLRYAKGRLIETMVWRMDVSGRAVPLGEYPRRQTKRGVSLEVRRGSRVLLQSAFLAKRKAGRDGVFLRPGKERYPMGHRLGMSVADSMRDGVVPRRALERGALVFSTAFGRLLKLELDGG